MSGTLRRIHAGGWFLLLLLLLARVPSLVQPAGADQGLYAYIGQRILVGDVPYVHAWDQKPPGVHLAYAALIALWPHESFVAGADLVVAAATALALLALGTRLASPATGVLAAAIFLLLGNPALGRLGGVRVRGQCEVFIALAVAGALLLLVRGREHRTPAHTGRLVGAGVLLGIAILFKYNAAAYALPLLVAAAAMRLERTGGVTRAALAGDAARLAAGAAAPVVIVAGWLWASGALDAAYRATILYNLHYSGETYGGPASTVVYLLTFPVRHARVDGLWFVGGAGCAILTAVVARTRRPAMLVPLAWTAAACLAIAINGSRGLPQYFVQAGPPLALAAAMAGTWIWTRTSPVVRVLIVAAAVLGVVRVANFPKLVDYTLYDVAHMRGTLSRTEYLSRFGGADSDAKYSALAVARLADVVRRTTAEEDRVLIFGFSPWGYVGSGRASASRFFWSRPVIIGFEEEQPGYGVDGLLDELERARPRLVVLQERDWDPDVANSADFFLGEPRLSGWLNRQYALTTRLHNFQIWTRETD